MNRFKNIIGIIIISLMFFGCGGEIAVKKNEEIVEVGMMKNLGGVLIDGKADHILEKTNGEILYLYSSFVDLDKDIYKNANVQITGEIVSTTESGKNIVAINGIVPLLDSSPLLENEDEIEEKYSNLTLGFKLDHINNLVSNELDNGVEFSNEDGYLKIIRHINVENLTLEDWLINKDIPNTAPTLLGSDKLESYFVATPGLNQYFLLRSNSNIYEIDIKFSTDAIKADLKTIINTFRFIPFNDDGEALAEPKEEEGVDIELTADDNFDLEKEYFSTHIGELNPDYGGENEYYIQRLEFIKNTIEGYRYLYVVYDGSETEFKTLFKYLLDNNEITSISTLAHYEAGEEINWVLKDGEDAVKNNEKLVVYMNGNNDEKAVSVASGYRLFESVPFNFSLQYPSNWYVQGSGGKYLFNDAPLNGSYLIYVQIVDKSFEEQVSELPYDFQNYDLNNDEKAMMATVNDSDGVYMVIERNEGSYVLWSHMDYSSILIDMANSIVSK